MNTGQTLVIILVTAIILIMVTVAFQSFQGIFKDSSKHSTLFLGIISVLVILSWFFLIFISDLYANVHKVKDECKQMQNQIHSDIMKKYTENTENCQT